jgi:hypothetical protein
VEVEVEVDSLADAEVVDDESEPNKLAYAAGSRTSQRAKRILPVDQPTALRNLGVFTVEFRM